MEERDKEIMVDDMVGPMDIFSISRRTITETIDIGGKDAPVPPA